MVSTDLKHITLSTLPFHILKVDLDTGEAVKSVVHNNLKMPTYFDSSRFIYDYGGSIVVAYTDAF